MHVVKVFNNGVVLARDESGQAVILLGAGLGYRSRPGSRVDESNVTYRFVPGPGTSTDFLSAFIVAIPPEYLAIATEMAAAAGEELERELTQSVIIPLAEHVSFAVKQYRTGTHAGYPLAAEVQYLYPRELRAARAALEVMRARVPVTVPDDEAVPITLHIVNAMTSGLDMAHTFDMTALLRDVVVEIERVYGTTIDRRSVDAARFVTHLRYLLARVREPGSAALPMPGDLRDSVQGSYPRAHACALRVAAIVERDLSLTITASEAVYLTLHVARLTGES
ncbi:MAG TPA: PRD domain-containing protein [Cellulomonas sp.]